MYKYIIESKSLYKLYLLKKESSVDRVVTTIIRSFLLSQGIV